MTWYQLKWIALLSMTVDHMEKIFPVQALLLNYFGVDLLVSSAMLQLMTILGRIAFPIYAYGIAQGVVYTNNSKKYLLRLLMFALISEIPFQLFNNRGMPAFGMTNVFFTLLTGAFCCFIIKFFREKSNTWIATFFIVLLVVIAEVCRMDYGGVGVLFIVAPYIFFESKRNRLLALTIVTLFFYIFVNQFLGFSGQFFQWLLDGAAFKTVALKLAGALTAVVLLLFYTGQKGSSRNKLFFYIFYPVHLFVLYIVAGFIRG